MAKLDSTSISFRALDSNGRSVSGAELRVYFAQSSIEAPIYSTYELTAALPQPVVANAAGIFPDVFVAAGTYKVNIVHPETGMSLPGYPQDDVITGGIEPDRLAEIVAGAQVAARNYAELLQRSMMIPISEDAQSVLVSIGSLYFVGEADTPYPHVTLEIV